MIVAGLLALLFLAIVVDSLVVIVAYRGASRDVSTLDKLLRQDPSTLDESDIVAVGQQFADLETNLERLHAATTLPLGDRLVPHIPWLGPRFTATRELIVYGQALASAGNTAASVGVDTLHALDATGISVPSSAESSTWLDTLASHRADIDQIVQQIKKADVVRTKVDPKYLPRSVSERLATVDHLLAKANVVQIAHDDLPSVLSALGERDPKRYLVLFQNPAELRPSGGFPGTGALVTIDHGQIRDDTFFDIHTLTNDYIKRRPVKLPQPYPIAHYFPQDGFLLQDATWWADFPRSGKQIMQVYAVTGWPKIDGVITVEPTLISDLLRITGPVTVEVDGQQRRINADNVYEEIERPRLLRKEGLVAGPEDDLHKEVLSLIGQQMIERLKSAERGQLVQAARALVAAADRRDVQVYTADPKVEAALNGQHWTGRIVPDSSIPTLAVTYANLVTTKASSWMHPATTVTFGPADSGRQLVTLRLDLTHTGSSSADPFYEGFQRWWIEVHLPAGSRVLARSETSIPDPDSPNGGTYLVELFPGQHGRVTVTFSIPAARQLLIRRQPGVTPVQLSIAFQRCPVPPAQPLTKDLTIGVTHRCS